MCFHRRVTEYLNDLLFKMAEEQQLDSIDKLTEKVHIWPDFHGNRSPIANPDLRGMVSSHLSIFRVLLSIL